MDIGSTLIEARTGERLWVRAIERRDAPQLQRAFARLSEQSRYQRFMTGTPGLSDSTATFLSDIDHVNHTALVAFSDPPSLPGASMVGVARFIRFRGAPDVAELAITVADAWQGKGVGTRLLELLRDRARAVGIEGFVVEMLAYNAPVRALVKAAGGRESPQEGNVVGGYIELARDAHSSLF